MNLTPESRRLLKRLIRREFDRTGILSLLYMGDGLKLIRLARQAGLDDLATEMGDDLYEELACQNGRTVHHTANLKNCA